MKQLLFGFVAIWCIFTNALSEDVVIQTSFGYIRGYSSKTVSNHTVDFFKGIPFAEKPNRLKKSKIVNSWSNVYNASSDSKKCFGTLKQNNISEFSEDCLYLNIVRPSGINSTSKLPVVVYLHGGGFQEGSARVPKCEAFSDNFVPSGMIVVIIQYRLAMHGFMSFGCSDDRIPCNIGLWDQVTAFEFINRTIEAFGGDPNNMTAMGHSAGAMSVSIHSLSPVSSAYFVNFIELSGSSWGLTRYREQNSVDTTRILNELNCNVSSAETILECVGRQSLEDMYTAQIDTNLWPEFGDDLLPDIPENLVKNTKNQRTLAGLMTLESLYFTYLKSSKQIFPSIKRATVVDYINSTIALKYGVDSQNAYNEAVEYYVSSNVSNDDYSYFMWQRTQLDSNIMFDIPVLREATSKAAVSSQFFLFHFPYFNPAQFDADFPVKATYHNHAFPYIWGIYKDKVFEMNADDLKVSQFLVGALINFIKTGNPSSTTFNWPQADSQFSHTVIKPEPETAKDLFRSDYNFWDSMAQKHQFDFITGLQITSNSGKSVSLIMTLLLFILQIIY